jgi:hypothetical protein
MKSMTLPVFTPGPTVGRRPGQVVVLMRATQAYPAGHRWLSLGEPWPTDLWAELYGCASRDTSSRTGWVQDLVR